MEAYFIRYFKAKTSFFSLKKGVCLAIMLIMCLKIYTYTYLILHLRVFNVVLHSFEFISFKLFLTHFNISTENYFLLSEKLFILQTKNSLKKKNYIKKLFKTIEINNHVISGLSQECLTEKLAKRRITIPYIFLFKNHIQYMLHLKICYLRVIEECLDTLKVSINLPFMVKIYNRGISTFLVFG